MSEEAKALAEAQQALRNYAWQQEQDRLAQKREDARQARITAAQDALDALRARGRS